MLRSYVVEDHAAFNAPGDRTRFVLAKVNSIGIAKQLNHLHNRASGILLVRITELQPGSNGRDASRIRASGIASGGIWRSTRPVLIALRGIPSNVAVSGLCATTRSSCLMNRPAGRAIPSDPLPERITAIAQAPPSAAREREELIDRK